MGVAMIAVGLSLRYAQIVRYWPLVVVMVVFVHFAAPASISHLYDAFFPRRGLTEQLNAREGSSGSGRLADVAPGLRSLRQSPLFGHGLGTGSVRGSNVASGPGTIIDPNTGSPIIFDDQYLNSLVTIGIVGLLGVLWFVWGGTLRLVQGARRLGSGRRSDLVTACAVATAGFGAGMLAFDAFSFVQCTLLFFVIMALGQRGVATE
jgi:O-antigen ligase